MECHGIAFSLCDNVIRGFYFIQKRERISDKAL